MRQESLSLLLLVGVLILIGLVMLSSASIEISLKYFANPFHYIFRHSLYLIFSLSVASLVMLLPLKLWYKCAPLLLVGAIILLLLVITPGIGQVVNGASRWINLIFIRFQAAEIVRLLVIIYVAAYLVRHQENLHKGGKFMLHPAFVIFIVIFLLLKQPDFGTSILIGATVFIMFFNAGLRWRDCIIICILSTLAAISLALLTPYRMERILTLLDPWSQPFASGYQVTQSLMAIGRGGWFGMGLGNSIQKFSYLPESYTDFIFAIIVEEVGIIGAAVIIILYLAIFLKIFLIGQQSYLAGNYFSSYLIYGIAACLSIQVFMNISVAIGLLPTTGLPLPFISYGGTNLLINCISIAIVVRASYEKNLL